MNIHSNKADFITDKMLKKFLKKLFYFSKYWIKLNADIAKNGQFCLRNLVLAILNTYLGFKNSVQMILQTTQNIRFSDKYYLGSFSSKFEINPATESVFMAKNLRWVIYDPLRAQRFNSMESNLVKISSKIHGIWNLAWFDSCTELT